MHTLFLEDLKSPVSRENVLELECFCPPEREGLRHEKGVFRGTRLNRTYGKHKNPHISQFLRTILGSIYYGPP